MTKKNILSLLTAGVMGISCFSVNVSAESAYAVGDVDMDGIITGHDTAMVSRYLLDEDYTLTEEQLSLADVDGDGEVTQADADKLYNEMQEYALGNVNALFEDARKIDDPVKLSWADISDCTEILTYYAYATVGMEYDFTEVQKNLADVDLNGKIDVADATCVATMYVLKAAHFDCIFPEEGIYYY
jgi:hypothetical protein